MKKSILILFIIISFICFLSAQKYDYNWIIGHNYDSTSLESYKPQKFIFTDTSVKIVPSYNTIEMLSTMSISDKNGKLLFYTNGNHIESASGKRMENGDGLNEGSGWADKTTQQLYSYAAHYGFIILPDKSDSNIYYLLHILLNPDPVYIYSSTKLQITKIDMSYNNGDGKVIYKNKTLANVLSTDVINATLHANGQDWWIMLKHPNGNSFTELLLHKDTLKVKENLEFSPFPLKSIDDTLWMAQPIVFSQDGSILVDLYGNSKVRIFNFDRCTGGLTLRDTLEFPLDSFQIGNGPWHISGVEGTVLSPNSRYLYTLNFNGIKQFDLWASNISKSGIKISGLVISLDENLKPYIPIQYFEPPSGQIGPDGKIYLIEFFDQYVINNPDEKGLKCNFCSLPECILTHKYMDFSPFYPNYRLGPLSGSECDTILSQVSVLNENQYELKIYPIPSSSSVQVEITLAYYDQNQAPKLQIYDMLGREVYMFEFPPFAYIHNIEAGTLPPGNYFSTLKVGGKVVKSNNLIISH